MKKRDRRITPYRTSLTVGDHASPNILDAWSTDAVPESTGPSEKKMIDTTSDFFLKGEGTSKENSKDKHNEIISESNSSDISNMDLDHPNPKNTVTVFGPDKKRLKNTTQSKAKKWIKENKARQVKDKLMPGTFAIQLLNPPVGKIRVPVVNPDESPAMPTLSSRARKWIEKGKAIPKRTKTGVFYVQLVNEPSGRNKQPIVVTLDPGSRYSGVAVVSKKQILYTCNLELIVDEKENKFASIKYRNDKRRELRRSRRHRNCRRRPERFNNRSKTGKMAPSIRSRKQLELKEIKELTKIYPISIGTIEDVAFNHYEKRWGKNFSQVEVGKKWLFEELEKLLGKGNIKLIKGYETNTRRQQLKLKKSSKKEERDPSAHVNDCIAMGSIILGLGIETKTPLRQGINFDIITRPKYARRKLHNEQSSKGGTDWTNIRRGDYIEAVIDKRDSDMLYRGWVGGFKNNGKLISVYNFDWKRIGQFDNKKVRLLNRNNGLMIKSKDIEENRIHICKYGTEQRNIDDAWK